MKTSKIFLITLSLLVFGCSKSDKDILVVGVSADYPPFEFVQNGEYVGFDIDTATEIANELGMKIKIIDMDFASLIPALNNDQIDMAISSFTITEERKKNIDFSDIYYKGYYATLFKNDRRNYNDFNDKKVGVQLGSVWEIMINEKRSLFNNLEVLSLPRLNILVEELKLGRIDMIILDSEQAQNYVKNNSDFTCKISDDLGAGFAIAFKLNSEIKPKVNSALAKVQKEKMHILKQKWFKAQ